MRNLRELLHLPARREGKAANTSYFDENVSRRLNQRIDDLVAQLPSADRVRHQSGAGRWEFRGRKSIVRRSPQTYLLTVKNDGRGSSAIRTETIQMVVNDEPQVSYQRRTSLGDRGVLSIEAKELIGRKRSVHMSIYADKSTHITYTGPDVEFTVDTAPRLTAHQLYLHFRDHTAPAEPSGWERVRQRGAPKLLSVTEAHKQAVLSVVNLGIRRGRVSVRSVSAAA
ncbi:MAG TPA: hypothetical protein VLF20_03730 [Patescibacteria group bacterium]|nr:hypothetical protein [Patescibacteria group bacterium]